MSVPADQFGNLGTSTDFLNTNALGLNSGTTATDALGVSTNGLGTADNALGPTSSFNSGATPGPAPVNATVGIGGTGAGGAPTSSGASSGTDWGSLFGSLGSDISSILNSPLGSLAEFTALYKLISGQAKDTQTENNALAKQISDIGQPDVTAGKNMLDAYTSGHLTAPFQAQLDAAKAADANTATSQTQQVASMLANAGGQNMQSAQVSQSGQIEAQKNLADQTAMSNAFLAELSASLNLTQTGGAFVQSGIMQEIQSNTQLQAQLADLMGALAKAYAMQTANSGKGGSGGGGVGGLINDVGSIWKGVTNLFGGGGSGVDALATATSGIGDISAAPGIAANVGEAGATAAGNIAGMDLGGGVVAEGAGAAGAGAGAGTAAAGAGAAGAGAAGAGAGGAAGAAGAAGAGAAGAAGLSGAGAYASSPAVVEAINATIPDAISSAGSSAGAGASGAAGTATAVAAPIIFAYMLYNAIQADKQAGTPMAQMAVLASNGPQGKQMADTMIAEASKYGDPYSEATWAKMGAAQAELLKSMGINPVASNTTPNRNKVLRN